MMLRLCGYDVVCSDKAFMLDTLTENVHSVGGEAGVVGDVYVCDFDWQRAMSMSSAELKHALRCSSCAPNIVILSDCLYRGDAVLPLLRVLNAVSS